MSGSILPFLLVTGVELSSFFGYSPKTAVLNLLVIVYPQNKNKKISKIWQIVYRRELLAYPHEWAYPRLRIADLKDILIEKASKE
jgi:hypothetical protein